MDQLETRKQKHLDVCLNPALNLESGTTGFQDIRFYHNPMPELDHSKIDLKTNFINYKLNMPILISSMTGGSEEGRKLNRLLAGVAQEKKLAIGTGSIRIMLHHPETRSHFNLKSFAPDIPVLANIGAVQLTQHSIEQIIEAVKTLDADGLFVHLNPAQEIFQEHGDSDFTGLYAALEKLIEKAPFPIIVKETGCGIPPKTGLKILEMGAAYIDVAGSGGTDWIAVESYRKDEEKRLAADSFRDWGYPTSTLLLAYRELCQTNSSKNQTVKNKIIASGGLRTPGDFAKSLACGAWIAGAALPFIRQAAQGGAEAIHNYINEIEKGIKATLTLSACPNLSEFRNIPLNILNQHLEEARNLAGTV